MLGVLKNLSPELQFLIFNGLSVSILGHLRCVCKKFSLSDCLKNLLDTHEDHARVRFERVVYTAKPFFPEKMINRTRSDEIKESSNNIGFHKLICIAGNPVGEFYNICWQNDKFMYWEVSCFLPERWKNFFKSYDSPNMLLQKHFIKTIDSQMGMCVVEEEDHGTICWSPQKSQIIESKYVNYAETQTQFWAVFSIVHQWVPEDFFASNQMFFN